MGARIHVQVELSALFVDIGDWVARVRHGFRPSKKRYQHQFGPGDEPGYDDRTQVLILYYFMADKSIQGIEQVH